MRDVAPKTVFLLSALFLLPSFVALAAKKDGSGGNTPPAPVEVASVVEKEVSGFLDLVGDVRALTDSVVSAEEPGRVVSFGKIEGDRVRKGEAVVLLDEAPYRISLRVAEGALAKAEAALKRASLAEKRARELFSKGIASEEARENAELEVLAARAEVDLKKAELDRAKLGLDRCKVRAPFDGYIASRLVDVGEWVKEGTGLFEAIDIHEVDVVVEAPERIIGNFSRGGPARVVLDAYPGRVFDGVIRTVSPKAAAKTRTFMVKIKVNNEAGEIMVGMVARVKVSSAGAKKKIMIPRDAVIWKARRAVVFTVGPDNRARALPVTLGRQHGEFVEAEGDVRPGQKVIVTGNEILRDGQPVVVTGEKTFNER